jgi:hypothetical protein
MHKHTHTHAHAHTHTHTYSCAGEWLQWSHQYAAKLGSLGTFLEKHALPAAQNKNICFLETTHGRFVRIAPLTVQAKDFQAAAVSLDPVHTAAVAIALVALTGPNTLLEYMDSLLQHELRKIDDVTAAEFTAVALEMMPHNLRPLLGAKVCMYRECP